MVQHFAAGALLAVIAVALLGEAVHSSRLGMSIGIIAGTAFMVALDVGMARIERRPGQGATGFLAVVTMDFFVDGLLLGVALGHESNLGLLLAIALTLEDVVVGVSVTATIVETYSGRRALLTMGLIALAFPIGTMAGVGLGVILNPTAYIAVLGFAAVALLFLVLEELLKEAHRVRETPVATALLFVGLLAFLLLESAL